MNECVFICGHASVGEELRYQDCLISCDGRLRGTAEICRNRCCWSEGRRSRDNRYPSSLSSNDVGSTYSGEVIFLCCLDVKYLKQSAHQSKFSIWLYNIYIYILYFIQLDECIHSIQYKRQLIKNNIICT